MSALLLFACEEALLPTIHPPVTTPPPPADEVVDTRDLVPSWSAAAGATLSATEVVGDVNGDGWPDAVVHFQSAFAGSDGAGLLVLGPFDRPLTLPGDEDARLWSGAVFALPATLADANEDDVMDLVVIDPEGNYVLPGPFAGTHSVEEAIRIPYQAQVLDVDADGVADQVMPVWSAHAISGLTVTHGPIRRWDGPADVAIPLVLNLGYSVSYVTATTLGDVTGDAMWDLGVSFDGWLLDDVIIEVDATPELMEGAPHLRPIGDQTGDGINDLLAVSDVDANDLLALGDVYASPLAFLDTFDDEPVYGGGELYAKLYPVLADVTGDGVHDFLALDTRTDGAVLEADAGVLAPPNLVVLPGGRDLAFAGGPAWRLAADAEVEPFVDPDGAGILITTGDGVTLVKVASSPISRERSDR